MKLLLIGPSRYKEDGSIFRKKKLLFPRLGLLLLAGYTPKDVEIEIIEEATEEIDFDMKCDLVGITAFTNQSIRAYDIAKGFREKGKTVIMGGIHVSSCPDEAKQHANSIVIGEADYLWENIIEDFRQNNLKPVYKSDKFHDLKDMPIPRYDLVKKDKYMQTTMPVQTSRGCPHNCDFCSVTSFFGGSYRMRPIDDVMRDIEASGTKRIFFIDDNITANRAHAEKFFKRLIPLKIRWTGQSTINLGKFPELCKLTAESGCKTMLLGVESINQKSLDSSDKKQNKVSDYYKLLDTIKENGLSIILSMIVGFDGDDFNVFNDTYRFVLDVKPHIILINVPIPFPGTKLAKRLESENRLLHKNWSLYGNRNVVFQTKLIEPKELEIQARKLLVDIYSIDSIIVRCIDQPRKNIIRSFIFNVMSAINARRNDGIVS